MVNSTLQMKNYTTQKKIQLKFYTVQIKNHLTQTM